MILPFDKIPKFEYAYTFNIDDSKFILNIYSIPV